MPLITPKTDWIAGDSVGFSDMNRIEGNILYLRNENKTINGTNTFTNYIEVTGGSGDWLRVGSDLDISASIGRGKLFSSGDIFAISHYDYADTTNRLVAQDSNGRSYLNSSLATDVRITNGNTLTALFSSTNIQFEKATTLNVNNSALTLGDGTLADVYQIFRSEVGGAVFGFSDAIIAGGTGLALIKSGSDKGFAISAGNGGNFVDVDNSSIDYQIVPSTKNHLFGRGLIDNTEDLVQIGSDQDINVSIGRGKLFSSSDIFALSHYDYADTTNRLLAQDANGRSFLNSSLATDVRITNGNVLTALFSSSQIDLEKKVVINTDNTVAWEGVNAETNGNLTVKYSNVATTTSGPSLAFINDAGQFSTRDPYTSSVIKSRHYSSSNNERQTSLQFYTHSGGAAGSGSLTKVVEMFHDKVVFEKNIEPTDTPTEGSWTQTNASELIPRGMYNIQLTPSGSSTVGYIEMYVNSAWTVIANSGTVSGYGVAGISIYSDGTNLRFRALNGTVTARYLKF